MHFVIRTGDPWLRRSLARNHRPALGNAAMILSRPATCPRDKATAVRLAARAYENRKQPWSHQQHPSIPPIIVFDWRELRVSDVY
jgi:hypothetical protein